MNDKVRIMVVNQERYDEGPLVFDGKLDAVIDALAAVRETIPAEYRDAAECSINADDYRAEIEISYLRPKSEAEIAKESATRRDAEDRELWEQRRIYERLRAKFEG